MKQTIAFVFVLFNTPTQEIERLQKEFNGYELYFIDNTSSGQGYACGVNKGIKRALKEGADIVFLANPDISIERSQLHKIVDISVHYDVFGYAFEQNGAMYYGGEIDYWTMAGGLVQKKPRFRFSEVDFVSGSLIGVRKEVIKKIGLFDESFGMYYEDVDYCLRARKAGFKIGIDVGVMYKHFETSNNNPRKKWLLAKNRLKIMMKYGSPMQKCIEILRFPLTIFRYIFS